MPHYPYSVVYGVPHNDSPLVVRNGRAWRFPPFVFRHGPSHPGGAQVTSREPREIENILLELLARMDGAAQPHDEL